MCVMGKRDRALLSHPLPSAWQLRSPTLQGLPPLVVQAQGRPRALIEFTKGSQDTHAFCSSGHEVGGVLAPSLQAE